MKQWRGILKEFAPFLPITKLTPAITLNEGNTPLVRAMRIPASIGFHGELYFKLEGKNPTGSFKDRGMVVAVAKALESGSQAIVCASTGNTSASAAAYAARAGIKAIVILPHGNVAPGKLAQALMFGASLVEVEGSFDDALVVVRRLANQYQATLVNSINSYRLEGQKTASIEVVEQLGRRFPDFHFIPVGNAGNITAYWSGYKEYLNWLVIGHHAGFRVFLGASSVSLMGVLPRMMGYQAAGAAPIVEGHIIEHPETVATAIRIGNPARWEDATRVVRESKGLIDKVTDEEILYAYKLLATQEGIFVEPASAAPVAGFLKAWREGRVPDGDIVVCTLTGDGLKDPTTALSVANRSVVVPADADYIASLLELPHR
ncbi:MAG: threonine synthase [Candidatus Spechtbacteria bacterium]|nr:threonine synthase [Candidatus Spechtbacteria bacterium]